jgi:hypothetical protein
LTTLLVVVRRARAIIEAHTAGASHCHVGVGRALEVASRYTLVALLLVVRQTGTVNGTHNASAIRGRNRVSRTLVVTGWHT